MDLFYQWVKVKKTAGMRLVVIDMWRAFETSTMKHAPQAAILYDTFHVMRHVGKALDTVRKQEYKRLADTDRLFIKGQKYTLLSRKKNLTLEGRKALNKLFSDNKRLNTASLLQESFGQVWEYQTEDSLGFVEGLNNKIRVIRRRANGLRDEEYLRFKVLTCMLKPI